MYFEILKVLGGYFDHLISVWCRLENRKYFTFLFCSHDMSTSTIYVQQLMAKSEFQFKRQH